MGRPASKLNSVPAILRDEALLLNGRLHYYARIRDFHLVSRGRYAGKRTGIDDGYAFTIEGGRHLGGTARDWFLEMPGYFDSAIHCTSVKDALDLLENM